MSKGGIYKITEKETGKFYIGSTINFRTRKSKHFSQLNNNDHPNTIMQNKYNKGRELIFSKFIVCTEDCLLLLEQRCIDILKPEFNIAPDVTAPFAGRKHTNETLNKMKASSLRGEKSPAKRAEVRKKMSENNRMRKPGSRETISGENHGCSKLKQYQVIEIKKLITEADFTQTQIAAMYGVSIAQISRIKTGKRWNLGKAA